MYDGVGVVREEGGMQALQDRILDWRAEQGAESNLKAVCLAIVHGALARRESRGGHFRSDFPLTLEEFNHRRFLGQSEVLAHAADKGAFGIRD